MFLFFNAVTECLFIYPELHPIDHFLNLSPQEVKNLIIVDLLFSLLQRSFSRLGEILLISVLKHVWRWHSVFITSLTQFLIVPQNRFFILFCVLSCYIINLFNSFCMKHHLVPYLSWKLYSLSSSQELQSSLLRLGSKKLIHFSLHSNSVLLKPFWAISIDIIFHFLEENLGKSSESKFLYCIM